jgi:hypothetical protein
MATAGDFLPEFPSDWEPTRATLHAYLHGVSALARTHAPAHPKWWHASLKVTSTGLVTEPMPLPDGGEMRVRMDFDRHVVVIEPPDGVAIEFDMMVGDTGTEFADRLIEAAASLGLTGEYNREKFENDDPRPYDQAHASTFWRALTNVASVSEQHRSSLDGSVSPLQLWPHGFDLSFEWFGTRVETYEEDGEIQEHPSQLNLGFYPTGDAYFYSNPWPFDEGLTTNDLPHGAVWNVEGWQGSKLDYAGLAGDPDAATKLREYAAAVFEVASPTLTA